ncbi:MAG TPA: LacI family DNA-binding transcriptional regulator [Planctomycetota bacterium]|jgi:LacI family transcriptional regulator
MATTIRDIARRAGVCIGTVSRVINNKDKVDPATRERILKLIQRTGYRPSALGRSLALQRSSTILLSVINVSDPYCAFLLKDVSSFCRARGYSTLLGDSSYSAAIEAEYLRRCLEGGADGAIVSPLPGNENISLFERVASSGFPLVLIDNPVPGLAANCVKYDDAAGARIAVEHLLGKGHRQIALCGWRMNFQTVRDRYTGYAQACRKAGVNEVLVTAPDGPGEWDPSAQLSELLRKPAAPSAILAENEMMAVTCIHALHRIGRRVPEDVAVVSFGEAATYPLAPIPLTTVMLHRQQAAQQAVHMLLDLIEQPKRRRAQPQTIVLTPELIVRESG